MNNLNLNVLARRRQELIARIHTQRASFPYRNQPAIKTITGIDVGLMVFKRVTKSPFMIAALVAAVVVIKPRRLLPLVGKGVALWKTVQLLVPSHTTEDQ